MLCCLVLLIVSWNFSDHCFPPAHWSSRAILGGTADGETANVEVNAATSVQPCSSKRNEFNFLIPGSLERVAVALDRQGRRYTLQAILRLPAHLGKGT